MRSTVAIIVLMLLSPAAAIFGQDEGMFMEYAHPHYAEAIRLGGPYVAVGRGLSCMHSNSAALGFQTGVQGIYSGGRSRIAAATDYIEAFDAAAAIHIPALRATLGIEFSSDDVKTRDYYHVYRYLDRRISLHAAGRINDWLALAITARRYESQARIVSPFSEHIEVSDWDISLSAHSMHTADFLGRPMDEIRIGLTLDNALGTEFSYFPEDRHGEPIHQAIRAGTAYFWRPGLGSWLHADLLSALVTFEVSAQGTRHEFRNWGTLGAGVELRLMEVFLLSVGKENFMALSDKYHSWSRYPVFRWGVGLDLPLHRLLGLADAVMLQLDYAATEWREDAGTFNPASPERYTRMSNAASAQLRVGMR
jgi:hypothetical protein